MKTLPALFLLAALGAAHAQTVDFTILKSLTNAEGSFPTSPPLVASNGKVYVAMSGSATNDGGSICRMESDGTNFGSIFDFTMADGASPNAALIEASDGRLYGTCAFGGTNTEGTIYRIDKDGENFQKLHNFTSATQGKGPRARLLEGSDGKLYGTCSGGGANNCGTVWRINKNGSGFQVVHTFTAAQGISPGPLYFGTTGLLYGMTATGGANNCGTIFRVARVDSEYLTLYSFEAAAGKGNVSGFILASDGYLYSSSPTGGAFDHGTLFRTMQDTTSVEVLHSFENNPEGRKPESALVIGDDGFLYGTTSLGGTATTGTAYRYQPGDTDIETLFDFNLTTAKYPFGGLCVLGGGTFLGTTTQGGPNDAGTVFRLIVTDPTPTPSPAPAPNVSVIGKRKFSTAKSAVTIKGTASNAARVEAKVGKASKTVKGTTSWSLKVKLKPGITTVTVTAQGPGGSSAPVKITITRE